MPMDPYCHRIVGVIRAATPLHVGTGSRTGVIKHSRPYLNGAVMRGAVGTSLIKLVCKRETPLADHEKCEYFNDCRYAQLFGEEFGRASKIFFRYAYPIHLGCGGVFRPAPKSLYRCVNPQCRKAFEAFEPGEKCGVCGESVKAVRGFRCDRCGSIERTPVRVSRVVMTSVDRSTCAAAQVQAQGGMAGTIHIPEVISAGSRFRFEAIAYGADEATLNLISNVVVRALPDEGVGGSKSRGFGKVEVEDLKIEPVEVGTVEDRANEIDTTHFRVDVFSPMILDGKLLDPQTLLEGARRAYTMAMKEGKPVLPEMALKSYAVEGEAFSGWSLRSDRRRAIEAAFSAGSVFEFASNARSRELAVGLAALEYYAIGAYKPHGCGQLGIKSLGVN